MKKSFEFKVVLDEKEQLSIQGTNDGFSVLELLGLFQWKTNDLLDQLKGITKPTKVIRDVIVDKE